MENKNVKLYRGLQGVYFDRTQTTYIDGSNGILEYRGYNIHDLAEKSNFEEVAYLLIYGDLPNKKQLDEFDSLLRSSRNLHREVFKCVPPSVTLFLRNCIMFLVSRRLSEKRPKELRLFIRLIVHPCDRNVR